MKLYEKVQFATVAADNMSVKTICSCKNNKDVRYVETSQ